MNEKNEEVVLGFIDEVINQKRLDRLNEYFGPDSIYHSGPFVGIGINGDDASGEKVVITDVAPGGPAEGKLQAGDVLLWANDGQKTWDSFQELRTSLWARGVIGSELTVRVLREGEIVDVALRRGLIPGWELPVQPELFQQFLLVDWPDLKENVECILEDGDMVSVYLTNIGTHGQYHQQAVWSEFDLYRVRQGKIADIWGLDDYYSQIKQLGYRIEMPTV